MKKITLIVLAILFYGCSEQSKKAEQKQEIPNIDKYDIIIIDSCEYIVYKWAGSDRHVITHKGNCKFCLKRFKIN